MGELAEFEKYAADFAVTEEVLRKQGFRNLPPDFHCLVAEQGGELVGFLVYYFVAFTYRAKPNLIIKELYVAGPHRSRRVGEFLMKSVAKEAVEAGCGWLSGGLQNGMTAASSFTNVSVQKSTAIGTNFNCRKDRFAIWLHPGSAHCASRVERVVLNALANRRGLSPNFTTGEVKTAR